MDGEKWVKMAGDGNDFLFFQGMLEQFSTTLVNPYSSESIDIDEEKNVNSGVYDGFGGNDILLLTNIGDALLLVNDEGEQTIQNVEVIIAGDGGDVIALADDTIILGDLTISGGDGDDILWGNVGDDIIIGSGGNDIIDGGPGHDILRGDDDNDRVNGGDGDDHVFGGDGDDILFGGHAVQPQIFDKDFTDDVTFPHLMDHVKITKLGPSATAALGIAEGNLNVDFDAKATITFREGFAGFNNTLGVYSINEDGTIGNAQILFANVKDAGIGTTHEIDLNAGDFGFFIIANGDRQNQQYKNLDITGKNNIRFVYDFGGANEREATIHDDGNMVSVVYDDGTTIKELRGKHYHTTERDGDTSLNWDGDVHTVSGLVDVGQQDVLRIGFEDLPNQGDADFEDLVFDLNINEVIVEGDSEDGNDLLVGGAGDDILYGQDGDDILIVGEGADDVYSGRGLDQISYDVLDTLVDTIHDFDLDNDVLNITDILEGYDPLADAIADFAQVTSLNGDTHININADGDVGGAFTQTAVLTGVETTLIGMINGGSLVADESVVI